MPCHSVQDSSSSPGFAASLATARPSLTPRWNPASRSRAAAGDLFGTTGCVPGTVPGTRFAFGSRWGSPAAVEPPEDGESTVSAACQPSSAGEDQRLPAAEVMPDEPGVMRPPLNQPDSTASKMGNRRVPAGPSADDTITPPSAEVVSWLKGAAVPSEALENCDILLSPGADKPGPERESIPEVSPAMPYGSLIAEIRRLMACVLARRVRRRRRTARRRTALRPKAVRPGKPAVGRFPTM